MPTIIDCPACTRKLRIPDELLGQKVKCPTCTETFDAVGTPAMNGSAEGSPPAAPEQSAPPPSSDLPSRSESFDESPPLSPPGRESDRADEAMRPCPYCGEDIRKTATHCRHCDEDLDDADEERSSERRHRPILRRDCESHRGGIVLVLGIVSIVLGATWILSLIGVVLGIVAWVMGQRDLRKMRAHVMDPSGMGSTQAGYICGIVGTFLSGLGALGCVAYIGFIVMAIGAASKMTPTPPPTRVPNNPPPRKMQGQAPMRVFDYLPAARG